MPQLYDMHCHLDFADNCKEVARNADGRIAAISSTVTPASFVSSREKFREFPEIRVALGLHPWWVAEGRIGEVNEARFENLIDDTRFVGEIGLDYGNSRKLTRAWQLEVFTRLLWAIRNAGSDRLIFLHAVKCYDDMFEIMDKMETFEDNTVVFHWFQGTPDDFGHALAQGCYFSVNMRMLATPAGKKFAGAIPADRLLIESDNPPHEGMVWSADTWLQEVENTLHGLAYLRGESSEETLQQINENSARLLQEYDSANTEL